MRPVIALLVFTNAAWAKCIPPEVEFMSCTFSSGKTVQVCTDGNFARYTFGRPGQDAELALRIAFGEGAEMVPWPGVGRSIWEAIRLTNNDTTYEVYAGFDRYLAIEDYTPDESDAGFEPFFGGISVMDFDGSEIAHLRCIPDTVSYGF